METIVNEPDASRLIIGLRDTGYDFFTAATDIVDNAIAANASVVNIEIRMVQDGHKYVYFGDDGDGMDEKGLFEAMRYGARARPNPASLGKFGLGLKTASSSICRKFSLISRMDPADELHKLTWDLDHVQAVGRWEMLKEPVTDEEKGTYEELCGEKGTLVVWERCDRLLSKEYENPGGTREQKAIARLRDSLMEYLALTYYRFLDESDEREETVIINVNEWNVEAWNPFYPERSEQLIPNSKQSVEIELADGSVEVAHIRAYILPHKNDMTKEEEKAHAKISNKGQGFYIHREGRVIQRGGWAGVFGVIEPHYSLLRIEFDFTHKLDEAFHVDVKKSRIRFDPAIEEYLQRLLRPFYREARLRYDRKVREQNIKRSVDHSSSNNAVTGTPGTKRPGVEEVDSAASRVTLNNTRGPRIVLRGKIETGVDPKTVHVEAVDDITGGELWEPALRSSDGEEYVTGVRINKHHDFYQKIYQRAVDNGYTVEGMDLLLWAFANAEHNHTDEEMQPIFEDLREEVSLNLKKLLRSVPLVDESGAAGDSE